jgi:hypothetical protein
MPPFEACDVDVATLSPTVLAAGSTAAKLTESTTDSVKLRCATLKTAAQCCGQPCAWNQPLQVCDVHADLLLSLGGAAARVIDLGCQSFGVEQCGSSDRCSWSNCDGTCRVAHSMLDRVLSNSSCAQDALAMELASQAAMKCVGTSVGPTTTELIKTTLEISAVGARSFCRNSLELITAIPNMCGCTALSTLLDSWRRLATCTARHAAAPSDALSLIAAEASRCSDSAAAANGWGTACNAARVGHVLPAVLGCESAAVQQCLSECGACEIANKCDACLRCRPALACAQSALTGTISSSLTARCICDQLGPAPAVATRPPNTAGTISAPCGACSLVRQQCFGPLRAVETHPCGVDFVKNTNAFDSLKSSMPPSLWRLYDTDLETLMQLLRRSASPEALARIRSLCSNEYYMRFQSLHKGTTDWSASCRAEARTFSMFRGASAAELPSCDVNDLDNGMLCANYSLPSPLPPPSKDVFVDGNVTDSVNATEQCVVYSAMGCCVYEVVSFAIPDTPAWQQLMATCGSYNISVSTSPCAAALRYSTVAPTFYPTGVLYLNSVPRRTIPVLFLISTGLAIATSMRE